jgi:hypothetical protein
MLSKPLSPRRRSKNALRYDGLKLDWAKICFCDFANYLDRTLRDILRAVPALTMRLDRSTPLPWVARAGGQPWLTKILARALLIVIAFGVFHVLVHKGRLNHKIGGNW